MTEDAAPWHVANANAGAGPSAGGAGADAAGASGPFTTTQLLDALRLGTIGPDASAWREGMPAWRGVADIEELRPALRARGMDGLPRKRLIHLGGLSVASGGLVFVTNTLRALAGADVGPVWSGLAGAVMAPGAFLLWKALRRRT